MAAALRSLVIAFGFLTRAPVKTGAIADAELGRAVGFFPVVGLVLGLATAGVAAGLSLVVPGALAAVGAVAFLVVVTGGLHLDGVADVFDGFGAGGDAARRLEVMRDARVGAHGAAAVSLVCVGKVLAVWAALGQPVVLFAFPMVARWGVVPVVALMPYARPSGLGRSFADHTGAGQLALATAFVIGALVWLGPGQLVVPALGALGIAVGFAWFVSRRIGGVTGDVYGACIELAELGFLALAV